MESESAQTATFAGGCFWCTEAIFKRVKGVLDVMSGYAGGNIENPDYEAVSAGTTGHAEAIQMTFEPSIISYEKLLDIFWHLHDPTTINQQGADIGTQYRSVIFYHDEGQKNAAEKSKSELEKSGYYKNPIITQIVSYTRFYKAEANHQNFYDNNPDYGYCRVVIDPKIQKLLRDYREDVKEEE